MTTEQACGIILNEGDHLHRMPRHRRATPLSKRDYVRGRLLLMVAKDAMHEAEYEGRDIVEKRLVGTKRSSALCR